MLLSPYISPSPSSPPTLSLGLFSMSVSPLLPWKEIHQCISSDSMYMCQMCQYMIFKPSLVAQLVKNPPVMWETWVQSLGWEDPLEKGKATPPVFWPGEFHGLYSPSGRKESDMTEWLSLSYDIYISLADLLHSV